MRTPDGSPDDVLRLHCPECEMTVYITRGNLVRIGRWAELRYPNDGPPYEVDLDSFPTDVDLTEPLDAATLSRVARAVIESA